MTQFEENLQKSGQIWDIRSENMNEISEESQKLLEQYIQDAVDEYAEDETKTDNFEEDSLKTDKFKTD